MIKVIVTGACGRMGLEVCRGIRNDPDLQLVGVVDVANVGEDIGILLGERKPAGLAVSEDFEGILASARPDVLVDFSSSTVAMRYARLAAESGLRVVIGTTGMTKSEMEELESLAKEWTTGILLVPNFALGAVLMMTFARMAAQYFPNVEIIEMHHDQKLDAPSGTSLKTADLILEGGAQPAGPRVQGYEKLHGARGGDYRGIHIHSVRLPGYIAHQEVIFGASGQTLTIRHDTTSRESFIPGVLLAIKEVVQYRTFIYGLENLLKF